MDQEARRRGSPRGLRSGMRIRRWGLQLSESAVSPVCALHRSSLALVFLKHNRRARAATAVAGTGAGHGCWRRVYIYLVLPPSVPIAHRARTGAVSGGHIVFRRTAANGWWWHGARGQPYPGDWSTRMRRRSEQMRVNAAMATIGGSGGVCRADGRASVVSVAMGVTVGESPGRVDDARGRPVCYNGLRCPVRHGYGCHGAGLSKFADPSSTAPGSPYHGIRPSPWPACRLIRTIERPLSLLLSAQLRLPSQRNLAGVGCRDRAFAIQPQSKTPITPPRVAASRRRPSMTGEPCSCSTELIAREVVIAH